MPEGVALMANYEARGTLGNKSRTGMRKPPNSGRPRMIGDNITSFTFNISMRDRNKASAEAHKLGMTTGEFFRMMLEDYVEERNYD